MFERLQSAGLKVAPEKCKLFQTSLKYLGHLITPEGVRMDPERARVIRDMPRPESFREAKRIFCLFSWYRKYVPSFSNIAEPLVKLCNAEKFYWDDELTRCFDDLKAELCGNRILSYPKRGCSFVLYTDSSSTGSGQILAQIFPDGEERVIAFSGNRYSRVQRKWTIYKLELFSFIQGVKKWYKYLAGAKFTWICDCKSALQILENKDSMNPRLIRWRAFLSQFPFTTEHRPASQMQHVDAISPFHERADVDSQSASDEDSFTGGSPQGGADEDEGPRSPGGPERAGGASGGGGARQTEPLALTGRPERAGDVSRGDERMSEGDCAARVAAESDVSGPCRLTRDAASVGDGGAGFATLSKQIVETLSI